MKVTISFEDFCDLRSGDLIVWRGKYLRTVIKGPADEPRWKCAVSHARLIFPIRRRSWTERIETLYSYNDLKDKIRRADQRVRGLFLKSEWLTLEAAGFNVREMLAWTLKDAEETMARMGREPCKAFPRLKRLIERRTSK